MINYALYGYGPCKLLGIHGWFGDETTFKPLELSLDPAEYQCAWLAHRGYGASLDIKGRYDMAEMAADAVAVADGLGWTTFSVIGHSMGGKAAQLVAATAPNRVEKLVLVAPVGADPVPFEPPVRAMFESTVDDVEARRTIVDRSTAGRLSPAWVEGIVRASLARTRREAFGSYLRSWADDDLASAIRDVDADTLVIAGAQDPIITRQICEHGFTGRFRNLAIRSLDSSGHYPVDEVPLLLGAEVVRHFGR